MPRKALKTEKPPLLFLERTLGGGRVQNVPEVRAALNPREFFTEQERIGSALHSWVSPQFDASAITALPSRRGRRGQASSTSILCGHSQISVRKSSVCKFPSLTFEGRNQNQPKRTLKKRVPQCAGVSAEGKQSQARRFKKTLGANEQETPSRKVHSTRRRNVASCSDGEASCSRSLDQPGAPDTVVLEGPTETDVTPLPRELSNSKVTSFGPVPDVDTPNIMQASFSDPVPAFLHLVLPQPVTPPGHQRPDILVPNTPERDYGLKVTWRRRTSLMLLLKESGRLSDFSIQNWGRQEVR